MLCVKASMDDERKAITLVSLRISPHGPPEVNYPDVSRTLESGETRWPSLFLLSRDGNVTVKHCRLFNTMSTLTTSMEAAAGIDPKKNDVVAEYSFTHSSIDTSACRAHH
jgi:hypothetical protein